MKNSITAIITLLSVLLFACGNENTTGGNGSLVLSSAQPRFAYVADAEDNSVSTYVVDTTTGRIKYIGKVAAGTGPRSITVAPSGKFAYVGNYYSNNVSQYSINADGSLAAITTAVAAGTGPSSVAVDPTGKYAYTANYASNDVSQYAIK